MTTATLRQTRQNASHVFVLKPVMGGSATGNINMNTSVNNETTRMKLEIETRQLQRSWKEFQESLHYQEQQRPHQPDDLIREIGDAIQYWSAHRQRVLFRKSIKWAEKCLDTMEGHALLMQTLPDSKRYCDLFFSVVYSIVRAAREQYRVAEAFLKFLARINYAVASAVRMDSSTEMVGALYGQIFLFLGEFLRDYVSKAHCRLLYSHNEDFKSNFKNLVTSVENLATMRLRSVDYPDDDDDDLNHVDHARLEKIGLEGMARRHASQTTTIWQLIWNTRQKKLLNDKLVAEQTRILDAFLASLQAHVHQIDADGGFRWLGSSVVQNKRSSSDLSKITPKRRLLKVVLQQDSSPLQDFFDNNEQIHPFGRDQRLELCSPIAKALFDWTQTNPSLPLAIECSHLLGLPGRLTLVSACYISVARQHNIPVISHFCASSPRTSKKAGLIALVYSLIRQLIELAPPMLNCDSNCDLSGDRFRRLNGTFASWSDALSILDTLLQYRPPVLICVIDALDVLEDAVGVTSTDDQTSQYVRELVTILASNNTRQATTPAEQQAVTTTTTTTRTMSTNTDNSNNTTCNSSSSTNTTTSAQSSSSTGLLKVLFTTAGQCTAVQEMFVGQGLGQVITADTSHVRAIEDEDVNMVDA